MPAAWRWSHNTHYHRWLSRQLPAEVGSALDVGCGDGRWARVMAGRGARVDGVDPSTRMLELAAQRCTGVRWLAGDVLDVALPLRRGGYDVVTAVSSLHHLPLRPGLRRLAGLVRPGGTLLVVGHHRARSVSDHALGLLAVPANLAVGASGRGGRTDHDEMPVRPPTESLRTVRDAVDELVPGAILRRGLYWRYLLRWDRPR